MAARSVSARTINWQWLTSAAFVLVLALAAGRMMMHEGLTAGADTAPGPNNIAGPATSLGLDILCTIPAVLILLRRLLDRTFALSFNWSLLPLLLLSLWMAASMHWAVNKFDALVSAINFISAGVLLWAGMQLVRWWARVRIVAAICFGLLLVYVAHGVYYKLVDAPALREYWDEHKKEILAERQLAEGSPGAVLFEKKVLKGELMGFSVSPNTYAACIVLFIIATMGVGIQRYVEREQAAWSIPVYGAGIFGGAVILILIQSKAAVIAPVLALGIFALLARCQETLARNWWRVYLLTAAALVFIVLAVAGHGIYHGSLPTSSMRFRWHYWVASARLFHDHPWRGVGWENFALYYLHYRLPQAPEEIRDPHNFIIRFLTELGLIGGVLVLAWLGRQWWELSRPIVPAIDDSEPSRPPQIQRSMQTDTGAGIPKAVKLFALIGFIATLIGFIGSTDLSSPADFLALQFFQRMIYFLLFVIGSSLVGVESLIEPEMSRRPAPWILYGLLAAAGLFLVQNLVDFSMFETGPMFFMLFLLGATLGARSSEPKRNVKFTPIALVALAALLLAGGIVLASLWPATLEAENDFHRGEAGGGRVDNLLAAAQAQPLNPLYLSLAARYLTGAPDVKEWDPQTRAVLAEAIARNPRDTSLYEARIDFLERTHSKDVAQIVADFNTLIDLNPTNLITRLGYGDFLDRVGQTTAAKVQYREALRLNDQLDSIEPKRIENQPDGKQRLAEIRNLAR